MRLILILALIACSPGPSMSRRIYGHTRAEWRTWMREYNDDDWSDECAAVSSYDRASWSSFWSTPEGSWSLDQWIDWWVDPVNWA